MTPQECPRFQSCNASVCPLDPRWRTTVHLSGEAVCFYLRATVKAGAAERFAEDKTFLAVLPLVDEVRRHHRPIDRVLTAAARSGFRGSNLLPAPGGDSGVLTRG